jgi:hypothetical protein
MPVPEGFFTKSGATAFIHDRTGYGRLAIENAMQKLVDAGSIHFFDHPGHKHAKLLSKQDVERVIAALTIVGTPPQTEL